MKTIYIGLSEINTIRKVDILKSEESKSVRCMINFVASENATAQLQVEKDTIISSDCDFENGILVLNFSADMVKDLGSYIARINYQDGGIEEVFVFKLNVVE